MFESLESLCIICIPNSANWTKYQIKAIGVGSTSVSYSSFNLQAISYWRMFAVLSLLVGASSIFLISTHRSEDIRIAHTHVQRNPMRFLRRTFNKLQGEWLCSSFHMVDARDMSQGKSVNWLGHHHYFRCCNLANRSLAFAEIETTRFCFCRANHFAFATWLKKLATGHNLPVKSMQSHKIHNSSALRCSVVSEKAEDRPRANRRHVSQLCLTMLPQCTCTMYMYSPVLPRARDQQLFIGNAQCEPVPCKWENLIDL